MTKTFSTNDKLCKDLYTKSAPFLVAEATKLKIDNVDENFFENIVIPLVVYLESLTKRDKPYFGMPKK